MLELGGEEERLHRELGERAARVADLLVLVGPRSRWTAEAARAVGGSEVWQVEDPSGVAGLIAAEAGPDDVILFKASRGMALERVVEALRAAPSETGPAALADQPMRAGGPGAAVVASHPMP